MATGKNILEAQRRAREIANGYENFECVECCMEIVRAIHPCDDAEIVKICTVHNTDPVILDGEKRISGSGHHVGVRIGNKIFDNHFQNGVAATDWAGHFVDIVGNPLTVYRKPLSDFFGRIFRRKEFDGFASSRHQD